MRRSESASISPAESRKRPRQARAKQTIVSIKRAVLNLAQEVGFDSITVADVADRASISKGALYQYFSGCEAIYLSLFEDASAEMTDIMKALYIKILDMPVTDGIATILRKHLALVRKHRLVLMDLPEQLPELNIRDRPITYENLISRFTRNYIEEKCPGLSTTEIDHRTFFTHEIARACIYQYVNAPPEKLRDKAFIHRLATIIADLITAQAD